MKKLLALFFLLACTSALLAQDAGRPDPTGRDRYVEFGAEVPYPGARVLSQLPVGATCNMPSEMVGARVWNSTREGHAILAQLSGKAQIAIVNGETFLCYCAKGFNQIFLLQQPVPPPAPTPVAAPVSAPVAQATAIALSVNPSVAPETIRVAEPERRPRDHRVRNRNRAIGGVAIATGIGLAIWNNICHFIR